MAPRLVFRELANGDWATRLSQANITIRGFSEPAKVLLFLNH